MKRILRVLSRLILILPAVILQFFWYALLFHWLKDYVLYLLIASIFYEALAIIYILNKKESTNYKVVWIVILVLFPIFGTWIYILGGNHRSSKPITRRIKKNRQSFDLDYSPPGTGSPNDQTFHLMNKITGMPLLNSGESEYFPSGEKMYSRMIEDLKSAKHFIFIEYFIIENGKFWDSIVEILKEKVKEGVSVRVMYDDIGSISTYSIHSRKALKKSGIDILAFNPVKAIHVTLNNRDHRKMMIIDNEMAYSGGVNIADEYINAKKRFGNWKDIGFRITGENVQTFTHMFSLFWNAYSKNKIIESELHRPLAEKKGTSRIMSYYDSPSNEDSISNIFFINLLGSATKFAYFYTPYLILNDSLKYAFMEAALRGIDVRIIIPGIPDKKLAYSLAIKYAEELSKYGVKVYKYNPGFIHAKAVIVDGRICSIGSVNLDYRSLYLHFEVNTIFDDEKMIRALLEDYEKTNSESTQIEYKKHNFFKRIGWAILNVLGPVL